MRDLVLELPAHESLTTARRLAAYVMTSELVIDLHSLPVLSQLAVNSSAITIQCVASASAPPCALPTMADRSYLPAIKQDRQPLPQPVHPTQKLSGVGIIVIDGLQYLADSCTGPAPALETYSTKTRVRVGKTSGEVGGEELVALIPAFAHFVPGVAMYLGYIGTPGLCLYLCLCVRLNLCLNLCLYLSLCVRLCVCLEVWL
jgi:hypothetical protein